MRRTLTVLALALLVALYQIGAAPENAPAPAQASPIAPAGEMEQIVFAAADEFGVDHALARAVLAQESGGDPRSTSSVGAAGLMQVMPGTAASIARDLGVASYDLYDPQTNARFGMYYLAGKIQRYGVVWGLAAYNWGPAGVDGLLDRHPDAAAMDWPAVLAAYGSEIPLETQGYVSNILAMAAQASQAAPAPAPATKSDIRAQIVAGALAQVGKPYVLGTAGPDSFDCSGLVQYVYAQHGIDTGRTTFDQLPKLRPIEPSQIQAGDMVYFQYSWDQHTGILADLDGDGRWDMIHAAAPGLGVIVTNDVFSDPFYANAIIGYRTAL